MQMISVLFLLEILLNLKEPVIFPRKDGKPKNSRIKGWWIEIKIADKNCLILRLDDNQ
jgi:hypothetical protein